MLSVIIRDTSQETKPVCDRICGMFRNHFNSYGYNGTWTVALYKKAVIETQNRIQYLHLTSKGKGLLYSVKHSDKPEGWQVSIAPPSHINVGSVERREQYEVKQSGGAPKKEDPLPATEPEPAAQEIAVCVGQFYLATVTDHLEHGMNVEVATKDGIYSGYVNLADISPTFDTKELNKYPVGKTVRIIVSDIDESKKKITCTVRTEGIAGTTDKNDLFSGVPDKDGVLMLSGFTRDINRTYKVLEWMTTLAPDFYPNPIPHDEALDWLILNLKTEYGVKEIEKRSAAPIFVSMCTGTEPLLLRIDNPRGYLITEFGWQEAGGKDKHLSKEQESTELLPALPSHVTNLPPEPVPNKARELLESKKHIPVIESHSLPSIQHQPVTEEVGLDSVVEFLGKMVRRAEVVNCQVALDKEKQELDKWIEDHKHLREAAAKLTRKD